jgi:hypothetical protein
VAKPVRSTGSATSPTWTSTSQPSENRSTEIRAGAANITAGSSDVASAPTSRRKGIAVSGGTS